MAFELGIGDRIVGVTQYDEKPDAVKKLPRVGGFLDVDVEAVARLAPDLVLVSELHAPVVEKLRSIGIPTLELRTRSISEVMESIEKLGRHTQTGTRAAQITEKLREELKPENSARPGLRVLVTLGRSPGSLAHMVAAGPGTYLDELLQLCGARNAAGGSLPSYPAMSLEKLVEITPDIIVDLSPDGQEGPWHLAPFSRRPRIVTVKDTGFSTPGVELGRVKHELCRLLRQ